MISNLICTPADDLPVALSTIKSHLGIEHNHDDTRLTLLAWTAIEYLEQSTGKTYAENEYLYTLDRFPIFRIGDCSQYDCYSLGDKLAYRQRIVLPRYPVASIEVKYLDSEGDLQTLDEADYNFCNPSFQPPYIEPVTAWNVSTAISPEAVQITFTTGSTTIPKLYIHTLAVIVGWLNENREGQAKDVAGLDRLIAHLRDGSYR